MMTGAKINKLADMKLITLLNTKSCVGYFGLFAPCLMFYMNGYGNYNRITISLIFFKFYLILNKSKQNNIDVSMYGFYFKSDPDAFILCCNNYYKSILMPWTQVVVKRQLMTSNDIIFETDNDCLSNAEIKELMSDKELKELCTRYYNCNGKTYKYYVTYIIKRPALFKHIPIFNNESFEIYTTLDTPIEGKSRLKMNTKYNIAIEKQINAQIAAFDSSEPF